MLRSSTRWPRFCSAGSCCGFSGGNEFSSRCDGHASLGRMWSREIVAARFLRGFELHHLHPRQIRVKHIELPLAVFADLRRFVAMRLPTMRFHNRLCLLHVRNTERDVIHHTREFQVHMLGLVQHIFQPISAVRNLHCDPVIRRPHLIVAMPVKPKTENVAVKVVFGVLVVNHETGCGSCGATPRNPPTERAVQICHVRQTRCDGLPDRPR